MDTVDQATRSRIMASIRSRGNGTTEEPMARALRSIGVSGWRRHRRIRTPWGFVRPDFVFPRERVAVMVQGCFWHCCPKHGSVPKSNRGFWEAKLDGNRRRDRRNGRFLRSSGWDVVTIWEHSVKSDPVRCAESVLWRLYSRI